MSTLPAGSIPDHYAVDSGTPPGREAEAESTGERWPSIRRREDANKKDQIYPWCNSNDWSANGIEKSMEFKVMELH
ncbi:unnamed protein product [Caretta caretta]